MKEQPKWMLATDELLTVACAYPYNEYEQDFEYEVAKAQAHKLVEWLEQPCEYHFNFPQAKRIKHRGCSQCMGQLKKEVRWIRN